MWTKPFLKTNRVGPVPHSVGRNHPQWLRGPIPLDHACASEPAIYLKAPGAPYDLIWQAWQEKLYLSEGYRAEEKPERNVSDTMINFRMQTYGG